MLHIETCFEPKGHYVVSFDDDEVHDLVEHHLTEVHGLKSVWTERREDDPRRWSLAFPRADYDRVNAALAALDADEVHRVWQRNQPPPRTPDWPALVRELKRPGLLRRLFSRGGRPSRVRFAAGLTDVEVERVEERHGFRFPPDLRAFLQTALPKGDGFPDWRRDPWPTPRAWMEDLKRGVLLDVEHADVWLPEWGPRSDSLATAIEVASDFLDAVPTLVPVYMHRFLPAEPCQTGNPVFSIHQSDLIYYGWNLEEYLRNEFLRGGPRGPARVEPPSIPFWSRLLDI